MDTVGTGSASQFRLYERQLGWKPPCPRRGRRPSISGTRFMPAGAASTAPVRRLGVQWRGAAFPHSRLVEKRLKSLKSFNFKLLKALKAFSFLLGF